MQEDEYYDEYEEEGEEQVEEEEGEEEERKPTAEEMEYLESRERIMLYHRHALAMPSCTHPRMQSWFVFLLMWLDHDVWGF